MTRIYLSLGSNLGDRAAHLHKALDELGDFVSIRQVSRIYETAPVGVTDQPDFLNLAVEADTGLKPDQLLAGLKSIERKVGRVPGRRWGPRVVDIDILLYGSEQLETPQLTLPHPQMTNRAFVLIPLAEIAPNLKHPISDVPVARLRDQVTGLQRIRPYEPDPDG